MSYCVSVSVLQYWIRISRCFGFHGIYHICHWCMSLSVCVCPLTDTIKRVLVDYHERINSLEDVKFDLEYAVKKKDFEVELWCTSTVDIFCLEIYLFLVIYVQDVSRFPIVSLSSSCFLEFWSHRQLEYFTKSNMFACCWFLEPRLNSGKLLNIPKRNVPDLWSIIALISSLYKFIQFRDKVF